MALSDDYRLLARLIDVLEDHGVEVRAAVPADGGTRVDGSDDADDFVATLEVALTSETDFEDVARPAGRTASSETPVYGATSDGTHNDEPAAEEPGGTTLPESVGENETTGDDGEHADDTEQTVTDVECTHPDCARTFETERGMKIHRTKAHSLAELVDGGEGVDYADPEALAEVYRTYDTFAEMTEALDADVGTQAVRKQMIRHGIHTPSGNSADEASDESGAPDGEPTETADSGGASGEMVGDGAGSGDSAEQADSVGTDHEDGESADIERDGVEDGETGNTERDGVEPADTRPADTELVSDRLPDVDLPDELTMRELQSAVESANTLYDVQRALELDRETTQDVLEAFDLLELVTGRAAGLHDREELKMEISERLRQSAT